MGKILKRPSDGSRFSLMEAWANHQALVMAVTLCVFLVLPKLVNTRYFTTIMINCALYGVLALSLNLMSGILGITSLGHAAFYGVGAYTAALLATRYGVNFTVTFIAAAIVAGLVAFVIGLPIMRVSGRQLAIITLGFCEIVRIIELNWMGLTNGPLGVKNIPTFTLFGIKLKDIYLKYLIALLLLVIVFYMVQAIENSRTGRAMKAIKDNDIAAEAMGINVYAYKLLIFTVSAAMAGLAGAYYAHYIGFIDPKLFTFDQSILILSMVILGGMGSVPGSILGAVALSAIPELLRGLEQYRQIIYGVVIVLLMVLKPNGILGSYNLKYIRQRSKTQKQKAEAGENG